MGTTEAGVGTAEKAEPGGSGGAADPGQQVRKGRRSKRFRVVVGLSIALVLLLGISAVTLFVGFKRYGVPSAAMEPTIHAGDDVWVNKLAYQFGDVERGDVVVFDAPETVARLGPDDSISSLVKRVIGLPGDTIEARDDGFVYIDGRRLDEPYLASGTQTLDLPEQTVPDGEVFVLGDNRMNSQDSRVFGPVDEDAIVGRVMD